MPARTRSNVTPPGTFLADDLPEVLRSTLVAGIVIAALESSAQDTDAQGDYAESMRDVLRTTAQEIRDWHTPKPRQPELNGQA